MALPGVTQTERDGALGAVAVSIGEICVVFGCSSSGTAATVKAYAGNDVAGLRTDYGYGPGPQCLSLHLARGKRGVLVKLATVTAGAAVAPIKSGGGNAVPSAAGANDTRHIRVEVLTGGALGTAGIVFRYSLDNGVTWSQPIALGTALTYLFPNSGTTLTWGAAAATVTSTTRIEIRTTEPLPDATAIAAGFVALSAAEVEWDFWHVVGGYSKTLMDAISTANTTMIALLGKKTSGFVDGERQDYAAAETEAAWMAAAATEFSTANDSHIVVGAGEELMFSPLDSTKSLRPCTWDASLRAVLVDSLKYELGRVKADGAGGPITGSIFDATGQPIAHNEERTPGLDTTGTGGTTRFLTLRTHPTKGRFAYITRANTMALPGSDFSTWRLRRGMDVACNITRGVLTNEIQETPPLEPVGSARAGKITVAYAKSVEAACRNALRERLIRPGRVSDAYVVVGLDDNILSTKKITVSTYVLPLGQVEYIDETDQYINPALAAQEG
jgi:hypothetical protein